MGLLGPLAWGAQNQRFYNRVILNQTHFFPGRFHCWAFGPGFLPGGLVPQGSLGTEGKFWKKTSFLGRNKAYFQTPTPTKAAVGGCPPPGNGHQWPHPFLGFKVWALKNIRAHFLKRNAAHNENLLFWWGGWFVGCGFFFPFLRNWAPQNIFPYPPQLGNPAIGPTPFFVCSLLGLLKKGLIL